MIDSRPIFIPSLQAIAEADVSYRQRKERNRNCDPNDVLHNWIPSTSQLQQLDFPNRPVHPIAFLGFLFWTAPRFMGISSPLWLIDPRCRLSWISGPKTHNKKPSTHANNMSRRLVTLIDLKVVALPGRLN